MLAERPSKIWGQQVFIENKGGAGTNIGNEYSARSDPDGYSAKGSSPDELGELLKSEIARWSAVIKWVGIKID